ncbi:hypothetical protein D9M68_19590 [compost metagenome]
MKVDNKRKLNQLLAECLNKLVASNVIDDTAFSAAGHCFHVEVMRDDGIVRYSMFGEPLVEARVIGDRVKEVCILKMDTWKELEIGFEDLVEAACDVLDITMERAMIA